LSRDFYFLELTKKFRIIGLFIYVVDIDKPDHSFLIDDKNSSFGDPAIPENTIFQRDLSMGIEIAHERIREPTQRFCPCVIRRDIVCAHTQNLGIQLLKLGNLIFV